MFEIGKNYPAQLDDRTYIIKIQEVNEDHIIFTIPGVSATQHDSRTYSRFHIYTGKETE